MKINRIAMFATAIAMVAIMWTGCKKETENTTEEPTTPVTSATTLNAKLTTVAPIMDGTIDADWSKCDILSNKSVVPNIPDFNFFQGESYDFTMRSMYDTDNIYFLVEYADPKLSDDRQSWYFDTTAKRWKQHNKFPTNANDKFYEDKFAFLWPTASTSLTDWNSTTCYSSCHDMNQTLGYNTAKKHYAEPGEAIDMWHYKLVRTGVFNMVDDQKIIPITDLNNPTATEKADGGRGSDASTAGGYADNKQTLGITGDTATKVSVPKYIIPGQTGYSSIAQTEIDGGTAKLVTGVDANGVLTYAGGTIDPTGDAGYAPGTGAKRFPSIINKGAFVGSRGDLTCFAKHTGTKWVVEIKRKLNTTDSALDIQFEPAKTYMFGFAIFENAAIAHGIKTNLLLQFAK